jgi:hypothetical protein
MLARSFGSKFIVVVVRERTAICDSLLELTPTLTRAWTRVDGLCAWACVPLALPRNERIENALIGLDAVRRDLRARLPGIQGALAALMAARLNQFAPLVSNHANASAVSQKDFRPAKAGLPPQYGHRRDISFRVELDFVGRNDILVTEPRPKGPWVLIARLQHVDPVIV